MKHQNVVAEVNRKAAVCSHQLIGVDKSKTLLSTCAPQISNQGPYASRQEFFIAYPSCRLVQSRTEQSHQHSSNPDLAHSHHKPK